VTRIPLSRSKGQGHQAALLTAVLASGGCSGGRGNVLTVGNCCYVAVYLAAQGVSAPTGRRGAGAYRGGRPPAYSLLHTRCIVLCLLSLTSFRFFRFCSPTIWLMNKDDSPTSHYCKTDATEVFDVCDPVVLLLSKFKFVLYCSFMTNKVDTIWSHDTHRHSRVVTSFVVCIITIFCSFSQIILIAVKRLDLILKRKMDV